MGPPGYKEVLQEGMREVYAADLYLLSDREMGVGEAVAVYVDARTGEFARFGESEFETLERAMNTCLDLYARCYGVDFEVDCSVRTAAEALVDTHDIVAVARILTGTSAADSQSVSGQVG